MYSKVKHQTTSIPVPYTTTTPKNSIQCRSHSFYCVYILQMASTVVGNGINCYIGHQPLTKGKMPHADPGDDIMATHSQNAVATKSGIV